MKVQKHKNLPAFKAPRIAPISVAPVSNNIPTGSAYPLVAPQSSGLIDLPGVEVRVSKDLICRLDCDPVRVFAYDLLKPFRDSILNSSFGNSTNLPDG